MTDSQPHHELSALAAAALIQRGDVSSEELTRAALARMDQVNATINAVVYRDDTRALTAARDRDRATRQGTVLGPLHGVPITIKDSHDTAGWITTGGTMGRRRFMPQETSPPVARLLAAGAVLVGKTNTPELTLSFSTDNDVYGLTRNPYDPARSAGGSSGGAGAALAARLSHLDLGSDLGGSIRVPAMFNGVVGLKPTPGRVPRTGHILPWGGPCDWMSTIGPMARSVDDVEAAFRLICGPDGVDPYIMDVAPRRSQDVDISQLRVGWFDDNGLQSPSDAVRAAMAQVVSQIRETGATTRPTATQLWVDGWCLASMMFAIYLPPAVREALIAAQTTDPHRYLAGDVGDHQVQWLDSFRRLLTVILPSRCKPSRAIGEFLASTPGDPLTEDLRHQVTMSIAAARSQVLRLFGELDAVICPVVATGAPSHADAEISPFTYTNGINVLGVPSLAIPTGLNREGLPVGVQIIAAPHREDIALALGRLCAAELTPYST